LPFSCERELVLEPVKEEEGEANSLAEQGQRVIRVLSLKERAEELYGSKNPCPRVW
jgi:hypothetical protein